jgi:hypothetical protein
MSNLIGNKEFEEFKEFKEFEERSQESGGVLAPASAFLENRKSWVPHNKWEKSVSTTRHTSWILDAGS